MGIDFFLPLDLYLGLNYRFSHSLWVSSNGEGLFLYRATHAKVVLIDVALAFHFSAHKCVNLCHTWPLCSTILVFCSTF